MMQDTGEDWSRIDAVLDRLLDIPEAEREAWLRETLREEPSLRDRIDGLLAAERQSRALFKSICSAQETFFADAIDGDAEEDPDPRIGATYGVWRITGLLGTGGLATVYKAERADGRYDQTVALKIVRAAGLSAATTHQFFRERQILSTLEHPGLARIIDGGETATGAPWYAMDFVEGEDIVHHCISRDLPMAKRLLLLADVADAVQAAHNRLVLHGDIKPANVIVDTDGRARLLDFGIAQLIDEEAAGACAMTPAYASPEQKEHAPLSVASDVYQLGLLLGDLARDQSQTPQLQAVVSKALLDRPEDRYASAAQFASELRKLAAGKAPDARPDRPHEALRRLAREHSLAFVLAMTILVGIVAFAATVSIYASTLNRQKHVAEAAADRADRGKQVLMNLYRRADPVERDGAQSQALALLNLIEPSLDEIRGQLKDDPELQARLVGRVARSRERADRVEGAFELAREAEDILRKGGASGSTAYAAARAYRATLQMRLGEGQAGKAVLDDALRTLEKAPLADPDALDGMLSAAWTYEVDLSRQRDLFAAALERALAVSSVNAEIEALVGMGRAETELERFADAEVTLRKAVARTESLFGPDHPRLAMPLSDLGRVLLLTGQIEEGVKVHRRGMALSEAVYGKESSTVLHHRSNLALALSRAGEHEAAVREFKQILAIRREHLGSDIEPIADVLQNLGTMQARARQHRDALKSLREAKGIFTRVLPKGHPKLAFPDITMADSLLVLGRPAAAEIHAARAFDILSQALPPGHFATQIARCLTGTAHLRQGDRVKARMFVEPAAAALAAKEDAPTNYREGCLSSARELGIKT